MMTQDAKVFPQFWDLAKGVGLKRRQGLHQHRRHVGKGRLRRTLPRLQHHRLLRSAAPEEGSVRSGLVLPKDYTLVFSRVAFISKTARNPNAAKLFSIIFSPNAARR